MNSLVNKVEYDDLIEIEKNNDGDIVFLSTNSYKINLINKQIAIETQSILQNLVGEGIPVPWLAFSGIQIFSGYGQPVKFKSLSVSSVSCKFDSRFESVGINQTLHSIYIRVECLVNMNLPVSFKSVTYKNNVLISEAVLSGKVPDFYLNGSLFNESLKEALIP